jgi:hypothetical protein
MEVESTLEEGSVDVGGGARERVGWQVTAKV